MLSSFISSTKKRGKINPQEFWALREIFAPGVISVDKPATVSPFLVFKSSKITSDELLVPAAGNNSRTLPTVPRKQQVDFRTNTELIYHDNTTMHIFFLKPISEMVKANATYDYKDKDKKFLEGKLWFVETTINTR